MIDQQPLAGSKGAEVLLPPHSRIRIRTFRDGGTEFYFPPARNVGTLLYLTLFVLVFLGIAVACFLGREVFLGCAFGLGGGLFACVCFNYWFKSSRVTIGPETVRAQSHWLFIGPTRLFDTRDVDGFESNTGMTSGKTVFYNLRLRTRGGKRVTIAGLIPGAGEAEWLCEEMTNAVRRQAAMNREPSATGAALDPEREARYLGIQILDRADGGREFVFSAKRNFSEKMSFSILWLVITGVFGAFAFLNIQFINEFPLPGVIRFFVLNHTWYITGILGLFSLVLGIACADMWLRSSRVIITAGRLETVRRWLFLRRSATVAANSIIEVRVDVATTSNTTIYYDILVLTLGDKPGWLVRNFPPKPPQPGSSYTENDLKAVRSGGQRLRVATGIEGEATARWLASEIRRLLKLDNSVSPSSISP